jgi:hypothetical protein
MRLPLHLSTLILLALATTGLNAQLQDQPHESITNPSDLDFHARLVSDSRAFHLGQPIEIEISYSTNAEKKYQTSRTGPDSDWGNDLPYPHSY